VIQIRESRHTLDKEYVLLLVLNVRYGLEFGIRYDKKEKRGSSNTFVPRNLVHG
jgi:hypothetical protein